MQADNALAIDGGIKKQLYHVTLQVFGTEGTILENRYYSLPVPFFPEDAKKAYMREFPDRVPRRELIVVINWSNQEDNALKYARQAKKDVLLQKQRDEVEKKTADGQYGSGDKAQSLVKLALNNIRDEEIADE